MSALPAKAIAAGVMALAFAALSAPAMAGNSGGGVHNVVELFTSQGCSSCPPADRLITRLARDPETLAVSFPVDYWDYIGWKDTLATPIFTARQKAYAAAGGKGEVYTPQAIVNGLKDAVGSDLDAIHQAERETDKRSGVLSVPLMVVERGGRINVSVGAAGADAPQSADVWLLALASSRTIAVQRGENAGSTLTYSNVVRGMTKIGDWHGMPIDLQADAKQGHLDGADSYAVIVQTGGRSRPSAILAAARGP